MQFAVSEFESSHTIYPFRGYNAVMFSIGSVQLETNLLLCPIAGYCDLAFRQTIRPLGGVGLASTDLVNPKGLLRGTAGSMQLVETEPGDEPLCIQLYGREPDLMAEAARWCVDHGAVVIDINMGCPVDKVCKTDAGSALLCIPEHAVELAAKVVRAVNVPVTVKTRLGWHDGQLLAPSLVPQFEDVGVAALTIHGRTAEQRFRGRVDLDGIARVVDAARRIPIIGNGDIKSPANAKHMMDYTGCSAVMIGRAALADPWLFRDTHAYLTMGVTPPPPTIDDRIDLMTTHFRHFVRLRGERRAVNIFRQRVSWYIKQMQKSAPDHETRDAIKGLHEALRAMRSVEAYHTCVDRFRSREPLLI